MRSAASAAAKSFICAVCTDTDDGGSNIAGADVDGDQPIGRDPENSPNTISETKSILSVKLWFGDSSWAGVGSGGVWDFVIIVEIDSGVFCSYSSSPLLGSWGRHGLLGIAGSSFGFIENETGTITKN